MIVICITSRIDDGRWRRTELIKALEAVSTVMSATLMVSAVDSEVVTAKAEQMPSICKVIGLFSMIGFVR